MLISTFYVVKLGAKTTNSCIVELFQNNCRRKNCRTSHLLRSHVVHKMSVILSILECSTILASKIHFDLVRLVSDLV